MGSLKVAVTGLVRQMEVARLGGLTAETVGAVVSPAAPVVNVHRWAPAAGGTAALPASPLPATSVALAAMVAVNRLAVGSRAGMVGVKVAVREAAS